MVPGWYGGIPLSPSHPTMEHIININPQLLLPKVGWKSPD